MKRLVVALLASGLVGCATASPIFYENQKYEEVGRSGAAGDIAECRELADRAGATADAGKAGQAAKGAGVGAVGGAHRRLTWYRRCRRCGERSGVESVLVDVRPDEPVATEQRAHELT